MKASELVIELQQLIEEYGDFPVNYEGRDGEEEVMDVDAYDQNGSKRGKIVEIFLH